MEKNRVKYLVSDMYRPYIAYVDKYFPNAVSVIDAFHVIQLINRYFLQYIRNVQRKLDARDRLRHEDGPIEALNRIPKDMKRIGRGYRNFSYLRNRFFVFTKEKRCDSGGPKDTGRGPPQKHSSVEMKPLKYADRERMKHRSLP